MKKSIFTMTLFACSALAITNSYGQKPDKDTEKAKENLQEERLDVLVAKQDLKDAMHADYWAFKEDSQMKFNKNEENINDLKIKVMEADEKFRTENQKRIGILEQKNISLQNEMNDFTNASAENWEPFKQKFTRDMDELVKALNEFTIL